MDAQFVQEFAKEWIAAWNAHDLDRVLAHYESNFELTSPMITRIAGDPSGKLKGKKDIVDYWSRGLATYPDLHFELLHALSGPNSVALIYKGIAGVTLEVFHFSATGKVASSFAYYAF
ncbi:MAG TPA: nuclear transport factor 2 family protein [Chromatiales bacterium]|nr:nuclear transport factor 2 family protein [Chromatiales bacterium]